MHSCKGSRSSILAEQRRIGRLRTSLTPSRKPPSRDQEVFTWARVAGNGLRKVASETLERITALRAYAVVLSELQGGGTGHLSVPQVYGR